MAKRAFADTFELRLTTTVRFAPGGTPRPIRVYSSLPDGEGCSVAVQTDDIAGTMDVSTLEGSWSAHRATHCTAASDSSLHSFDQVSKGIIRPCTDEVRDFDGGERNAAKVEAQAKRVAAAWPTWAWGKKP